MTVVAQMLETYPQDLGGVDREKLRVCIEACVERAGVPGADRGPRVSFVAEREHHAPVAVEPAVAITPSGRTS